MQFILMKNSPDSTRIHGISLNYLKLLINFFIDKKIKLRYITAKTCFKIYFVYILREEG